MFGWMHKPWVPALLAGLVWMGGCSGGNELPEGGGDMAAAGALAETRLELHQAAKAERSVVAADHRAFEQSVRVETIESPREKWAVKVDVPLGGELKQEDVVLVDFWMRTLQTADESGDGSIFVVLATKNGGWTTHRIFTAAAGKHWKHWQMPIRLHGELPDGKQVLSMQFGGLPQTVEIGGLRVLNYGQDVRAAELPMTRGTYSGREPGAAWRKAALQRIEKHRKSTLAVRVVDAEGQPVSGAKVHVAMKRHAFGFGCVINPYGAFGDNVSDKERYRRVFLENFNKAPLESGLRWQNFFRPPPERRREIWARTSRTIDWLRENGIEVRGHYLMWGPLSDKTQPEPLLDDPNTLLQAHRAHMAEKIALTAGRIDEWDTINHIAGWGRRYSDLPGGLQVYADTVQFARKLAPDAEHWINEGQIVVADGGRMDEYEKIIRYLVDHDAKPDGIGFMAHFRDTHLPHPQTVFERIDRFAKFGTKLQYTELDVECGSDEQLQADYLRDVLIAGFSHPSMEGMVLWGFWEGRHWRPDAALWRRDWSIKPAGEVWRDLVFKQWWTDVTLTTGADGSASVKGFHGTYTVKVNGVSQEAQLGPEGATLVVRVAD
ncbi:MAG: endo-1,4-beta-xylanase [Phycisphaerae bacterium]